jgi:hypothetical protein
MAGGAGQQAKFNSSGETGSHVNPMGMSSGDNQAQGGASAQYGAPANVPSAPRGIDWADKLANQNAVAVRRPVHIGVYADRIALLASRRGSEEPRPTGAVIMLDQPEQAVVQQLGEALQQHVQQWGLAGQGLYWRPELVLDPGDGGAAHAIKLARLLGNSGVDVRPLESAAHPVEGESDGTR